MFHLLVSISDHEISLSLIFFKFETLVDLKNLRNDVDFNIVKKSHLMKRAKTKTIKLECNSKIKMVNITCLSAKELKCSRKSISNPPLFLHL